MPAKHEFDFAGAMSFGANGMLESFLASLERTLKETGDVPSAERGSLIGQCWAVLKQRGLADPGRFVAMVRDVFQGGDSRSPDAWRDALNRHFGNASPQSAPVERLGQAASKFQQSAASSGGSAATNPAPEPAAGGAGGSSSPPPQSGSGGGVSGGGGGQGPPATPLVMAAGGGDDPLKRLAEAAEKLSKAAEKLDKTADKLGRGEVGTTAGLGNGDQEGGLSGWAKTYLNQIGNRLGASIEGRSARTLGEGLGRPFGRFARGKIGRGIGKLTRFGTSRRRPPVAGVDAAERLGTAGRAAAAAEAAEGAAGAGSAATEAAGAGAAAGGAEAAGAGAVAAGPVGIAVAAVLAVGVALKKFHDAVLEGAKEQEQVNFRLASVSASMAMVQAQTELRDTLRDMEKGQRISGTAAALSDSLGDYKDNTKELNILVENLTNIVYTIGMKVINNLVEPLNDIAEYANGILEKLGIGDDDHGGMTIAEWADQVKKEAEKSEKKGDEWHDRRRRDV